MKNYLRLMNRKFLSLVPCFLGSFFWLEKGKGNYNFPIQAMILK